MSLQTISEDSAVDWITDTTVNADEGTAPFVFVVGAGFSWGLVPTVKELLRDYLPASGRGRAAGSRDEHMSLPAVERERIAAEYWRRFLETNATVLKQHDLDFQLDQVGLPANSARAYQAIFDHRLSGGLNEPKLARRFLRAIMRPDEPRLNTAHFFLASLLGELRVLEDRRCEDGSYNSRFPAGVALSRLILTTNFDPFLQTALQFVGRPYYVSDRPELELDDLEIDPTSSAIHVVHVHGSIHRRSQISNEGDIQKIKDKNAQLLRTVLRTHGVIVLGYSGWDDAIVEALAAAGDRDHRLYWCGLEPKPLEGNHAYGPRVAEILAHPLAFYVPILDAGAFVFRLCQKLIGWPRLLTNPIHELRDRLESVNLAKVSVGSGLPGEASLSSPTYTIEQALAQTRAGLARAISTWVAPASVFAGESPASVVPRQQLAESSLSSGTDATPSASTRSAVVTLVKPGDSLADVLRAAAPGTRILLAPGTYEASLVIDKELELEGQGEPTAVRIESAKLPAIIFSAARGRVAGITLRQRGEGSGPTVDIGTGELLLENCVIKGDGSAGIAIHGGEANPTIRGCRIEDCKKSGVELFDRARGTLQQNFISHNRAHGVVIREDAQPALRGNQIHHNGRVGVHIDQAGGQLEGNDIFANSLEGVTIRRASAPELVRNNIYENAKAGVYVFDGGKGQLTENVIRSNKNSGVAIRTNGAPSIRDNRINFNIGKGVWCSDGAAGNVQNNDLQDNRFGPTWGSDDSTTLFSGNSG